MIIHNRETNQLNLVETIQLQGGFDLFMRSFSATEYCTLEVFRDDRHLASITPRTIGRRWDPGLHFAANTVLKVIRGVRNVIWQVQLQTYDSFTRPCSIEVQLHVEDATRFAIQYRQHSDPIAQLHKAAEVILRRDAQQQLHNTIDYAHIRALASANFSTAAFNSSGVMIDEVLNIELGLDPSYNQIVVGQQDQMVEEARIARENRLAHIEQQHHRPLQRDQDAFERERQQQTAHARREEERIQKEHDLILERMQEEHDREQAVKDAMQNYNLQIQQTFINGLTLQIQGQLEKGYSLKDVWDEHPKLRAGFQSMPLLSSGGTEPRYALPAPTNNQPPTVSSFVVKEHRVVSANGVVTQQETIVQRADERSKLDETSEIVEVVPRSDATQESGFKVKSRGQTASAQSAPTVSVTPVQPVQPTQQPASQVSSTAYYCRQLGLTICLVADDERQLYELKASTVFYVQTVAPGSPAQGRIVRGDFLMKVNSQDVIDIQTLTSVLQACISSSITIRVLRQGQPTNIPNIIPTA